MDIINQLGFWRRLLDGICNMADPPDLFWMCHNGSGTW